jgi:hypothetical protein
MANGVRDAHDLASERLQAFMKSDSGVVVIRFA